MVNVAGIKISPSKQITMSNGSDSETDSVSQLLPWTFFSPDDDKARFWVHYGLVIGGFVLAVITYLGQAFKPAPYGKHDNTKSSKCRVPQRIAHVGADGVLGVIGFSLIYFLLGKHFDEVENIVMYCLFELHYLHRGFIHPLITRYSDKTVPLLIPLGTFLPNALYFFINADWIGSAHYDCGYYYDPRFVIGIILFVAGYVINRVSDWKLRSLRSKSGEQGYQIPHGLLFNFVTCPNYLGEMIEWGGWTILTWSLAGLVWWLFTCATFVARSRHNLQWYREHFNDYPQKRKALIPFLY